MDEVQLKMNMKRFFLLMDNLILESYYVIKA